MRSGANSMSQVEIIVVSYDAMVSYVVVVVIAL